MWAQLHCITRLYINNNNDDDDVDNVAAAAAGGDDVSGQYEIIRMLLNDYDKYDPPRLGTLFACVTIRIHLWHISMQR